MRRLLSAKIRALPQASKARDRIELAKPGYRLIHRKADKTVTGTTVTVGKRKCRDVHENPDSGGSPAVDCYGSAAKPSAKPFRSTGIPMPCSGVWKTMKVADVPLFSVSRSCFSRITSA